MWILDELHTNPAVLQLDNSEEFAALSIIEKALIISSSYTKKKRPIIVVEDSLYNAQRLFERMITLLPSEECVLFSVEESVRVEAIASSPENTADKVSCLSSLIENDARVVITSAFALERKLPAKDLFKALCINIKIDDDINIEDLKKALLMSGYSQVSHIDQPLSFASRGGIVDIYSMNYDNPIRIEFFDSIVESIRFFDIGTQRTISSINNVYIIPSSDILFSEEDINKINNRVNALLENTKDEQLQSKVELDLDYINDGIRTPELYPYLSYVDKNATLVDYMENPQIIINQKEKRNAALKHIHDENISYIQEMVEEHNMLPKFALFEDFDKVIKGKKVISVSEFGDNVSGIRELHLPKEHLDVQVHLLKKQIKNKRIYLCLKDNEIEKVINECIKQELPYVFVDENKPAEIGLNITFASLFEGFELQNENLIVITSSELFEVKRHFSRFANKFKNAEVLHSYQDLNPGDYIVHDQHGVGQYVGLETREIKGIHRDFLKILYKGNDELLVPLEQFRLVRKFVSREGVVPKLHKLGSNEWTKTKERIKENVNDIADRLVSLYASREENIGYAYKEDDEMQTEFEKKFEYDCTDDQVKAIAEVKQDMMSNKPMDRLLCGDVGFGKTEVAIRAAFKAVCENKQVAYLCPTTILSSQHYKTFIKRFESYPVNIRLLNRFASAKEQTQIIKDLEKGDIDILIGTHRILSKDIKFKDLGLLIIDEEQRFGVEHKEKIKELKSSVDVLSLSATPIPRTLQMSLIGIRSLSQLETPPNNRVPVQTYVVEKNDSLITEVIQRELARKGQVFYLHNNTLEIYNKARHLQELLPEARIVVAHGKMNKEEIDEVMLRFINGEADVLVCTTIIETGIDISNANTILVENAENFGLAQLYQIKGRVGRSDRVAYAYLMIPSKKEISEIASKRLQAIKEFATLGSGYKIAMRDLTIRGAGDLLGPEQSGFIDTVGIDMYIEMLNDAINTKKGIVKKKTKEKKIANVSVDGYIPEQFAPDDYDKITMYQDIDKINTYDELKEFKNKVSDEYGRLPKNVELLFDKKRLDILINDIDVEKYQEIRNQIQITFTKTFSDNVDGVKLFELYTTISKDISIKYTNNKIVVFIPQGKNSLQLAIEVIERSKEATKNESR